jgi:hypothetical protein
LEGRRKRIFRGRKRIYRRALMAKPMEAMERAVALMALLFEAYHITYTSPHWHLTISSPGLIKLCPLFLSLSRFLAG